MICRLRPYSFALFLIIPQFCLQRKRMIFPSYAGMDEIFTATYATVHFPLSHNLKFEKRCKGGDGLFISGERTRSTLAVRSPLFILSIQ